MYPYYFGQKFRGFGSGNYYNLSSGKVGGGREFSLQEFTYGRNIVALTGLKL